jgi:hypothetical protein
VAAAAHQAAVEQAVIGKRPRASSTQSVTVPMGADVSVEIELHQHTVLALREAAGTSRTLATVLARYIDDIVQERTSLWRRALSDLENAGWNGHDVLNGVDKLRTEPFLHHFALDDVVETLNFHGCTVLARRVRRKRENSLKRWCALRWRCVRKMLDVEAPPKTCAHPTSSVSVNAGDAGWDETP